MATCYRHPNRETGVSCSNCGRPICPDCMTTTSVGMRCPECGRERTRVHTMRTVSGGIDATRALIAINVIAFLASGTFGINSAAGNSQVLQNGELYGPAIAVNHEYWRLLTAGFLHLNLLHILFNMYVLYVLGGMLEPALGRAKFVAVYFTGLLAGSFGALLLTPNSHTVGASGAVFALAGALVVEMRARGLDPMAGGIFGIGGFILINLAIGFSFSGISIGGHIGGLIGGGLAALAFRLGDHYRSQLLGVAGCVVIAAVSVGGAIARANSAPSPPPPLIQVR